MNFMRHVFRSGSALTGPVDAGFHKHTPPG